MRQAGTYKVVDGKEVLVEAATQVAEHGSRPSDEHGKPLYERPHERNARLVKEAEKTKQTLPKTASKKTAPSQAKEKS